jgi:tetratricopeptide (TPR) repeat protein
MMDTIKAQELAEKAKAIYGTNDFVGAGAAFALAAQAYLAAEDALMAAEMKNNESVSLLRAGETDAALEAVQGTDQVFNAAGDYRRLGMAHANKASVLEAMKRHDDAISAYQEAGEALEKAGEDQMRVQVMQLLSALYMRRWKFMNAIMALQSGLAGVKQPTAKQRFMKKILFLRL